MLQQFDVLSIQGSGHTSIKKAHEDNCFVDNERDGLLNVVFIQNLRLQSDQGLTCIADPDIDLFVKGSLCWK